MTTTEQVTVEDAPERHRYEAREGGRLLGFAHYLDSRGEAGQQVRVFTHTQVPEEFSGRGVASAIARAALDDVRRRGQLALPLCPYIAGWIERHEGYGDLVYAPQPTVAHD